MGKRIEWVDVSKFIAISCMIAGHLGIPSVVSVAVHMFHMPIFFIMAGFFFSIEKYKSFFYFAKIRFKTLLVPYFVWGGISYIIYRLQVVNAESGSVVDFKHFIIAILFHDANISEFSGYGVTQWFFTALFLSELFLWIVIKIETICNKKIRNTTIIFVLQIIIQKT